MKRFQKIADLTDNNLHGEAVREGLKLVDAEEDLIRLIDWIQAEHERIGYLTMRLAHARYAVYEQMLELARRKWGKEIFQEFKKSF